MKTKKIEKSFLWDFTRFEFSRIPQEDMIVETALKLWSDIADVKSEYIRVPKALRITLTFTYDEAEDL